MKKVCIYPIAVLMAALVIYGGAGINVASFCCNDCQSAGIEGIAEGFCCEIHGHDHEDKHHAESNMDAVCDEHEMYCFLSRVTFDWDASTISFINHPERVVYDLITFDLPDHLALSSLFIHNQLFENSTGPPFLCPRAYLSLLTALLI